MPSIDWSLFLNWIVTGIIGLVFGIIGGYVTYRLERKRDDLQWERERLKLELQWKHDREQMELVWKQKVQELELQFVRQDQTRLRDEILMGLNNPSRQIQVILDATRDMTVLRREMVELLMCLSYMDMPDEICPTMRALVEKWRATLPSPTSQEERQLTLSESNTRHEEPRDP